MPPVTALTSRCLVLALLLPAMAIGATEDETLERRQFTFSWQFLESGSMAPRGGTSTGVPVKLASAPTEAWQALRAPGIDSKERDRRAILAMAGSWRASFDFIETVGFSEDYTPPAPYQSWGTERVYVIRDEADFISLQHVLVMSIVTEAGDVSGPFVTKHWRQDWHWEGSTYHEFAGHDRWERTTLPPEEGRGAWVQTVWQVDDSPRYASVGRWQHGPNQSLWEGVPTLRPLPRREFSVRDDYHALRAINRHIITPTGWVQEEQNEKLQMNGDGDERVLAREAGIARYEAVADHDWSAGDAYWAKTGPFWAEVRSAWADLWSRTDQFTFRSRIDDGVLFMKLFMYAEQLDPTADFDAPAARQFVRETLAAHISEDP